MRKPRQATVRKGVNKGRENMNNKGGERMDKKIFAVLLIVALTCVIPLAISEDAYATPDRGRNCARCHTDRGTSRGFTDNFMLEKCEGFSNTGSNPYFILEPDYQLVLEGKEGKKTLRVVITVLDLTKPVTVDIDGLPTEIITRVVDETETKDGVLVEISKNYFAICNRTNSVMYFGEAVDIYNKEGTEVISHDGAWEAGVDEGARPGIIMPGTILQGGKYFQEVAPGIAMDRAEIVSINKTVETLAGSFTGCLKTRETTPLEPGAVDFKFYAPDVGLIKDGAIELIQSGFLP
jgi:hypothetical protein